MSQTEQEKILREYYDALIEYENASNDLKRENALRKQTEKQFEKSETDVKASSGVGHNIGEVLKKKDDETFIVKTSHGPRYVVGCAKNVDRSKCDTGARVCLDVTTLTITKVLPREVDPAIYKMSENKPVDIDFTNIGGLDEQIREVREAIEMPLYNPSIFHQIGIKPSKGVLLYGKPGTGKTLIARALAAQMKCSFIGCVASALVEKYIGESARMIRDIFAQAKAKRPCILFFDEIDAIGGKRSTGSNSSDKEVQRTLMELLHQLDGFVALNDVKVVMATNRPDILDPALLRPGRIDRKIEIGLPNEAGRRSIFKIHSGKMTKGEELDYDSLVKLSEGFNGADIRTTCVEAGYFAFRDSRDYVLKEDFAKAVRKVAENKKLENVLEYKKQ